MNDRPPMSDRRLRAWLEDGPTSGPDDGLSNALARTRSTRQRPGWLAGIRGDPMDTTWRARPMPPSRLGPILVTTLLLALLACAALLAGVSVLRSPVPDLKAVPVIPRGADALLAFAATDAPTSGARVPYSSSLRVVRADGTGERVLPVEGRVVSPAWSPDGSRIAFYTLEYVQSPRLQHRLGVIDADGRVTMLAEGPTCGDPGSPAWSPDGRFLLYVVGRQAPDGTCAATLNHVFVVPADGSAPGRPLLADAADRYTLSPAWGPRGILLHGRDATTSQLLLVNVPDPDHPWNLSALRLDLEPAGDEAFDHSTWSPDGRSIATTFTRPGDRLSFGTASVYPAIAGAPPTTLSPAGARLVLPSWSPDGSWLLAVAVDGDRGLAIVDPAGTSLRTLTAVDPDLGHGAAQVSPDGGSIAFRAAGDPDAPGDLVILDVTGTREAIRIPAKGGAGLSWQPLANPDNPAAHAPGWSPQR